MVDDGLIPRPLQVVTPLANDIVLLFQQQQINVTAEDDLPRYRDLADHAGFIAAQYYCVAELAGQRFLIADNIDRGLPEQFLQQIPIKAFVISLADHLCNIVLLAHHLQHWRNTHVYCGCCGHVLSDKQDERARQCSACHMVVYPRISPCVIVVIRRDKQLLLARGEHVPPGIYGCLAGFIEPGESAESAVHREVKEETGITITNLRYVKSQPWPFPDALMLGYTADHADGEIIVDKTELQDAKWFNFDDLPKLPMSRSIASQLIQLQLNNILNQT